MLRYIQDGGMEITMKNLTDILLKAERYNSSWSKDSLKLLFGKKDIITFNWDMESGERWASIFLDHEFICYISSVIPIAFCKTVFLKETEKLLEEKVIIISGGDFDNKNWFINSQRLEMCSSKLKWIVSEQVLNLEQFSINDFWYATI